VVSTSANATVKNQVGVLTVTQNLSDGQVLSGSLLWSASASGKTVSKVEFLVNGAVVATDASAPYEVPVDTKSFADGGYSFAVKAYATDSTTASAAASVAVSNSGSTTFSATQNLKTDQVVSGVVDWVADSVGKPAKRVEFFVDGARVANARHSPFRVSYDTRKLADGAHAFKVTAYATQGTTASDSALVKIANKAVPATAVVPSPPASFTVSQSIAGGQTLSGTISWTATPAGKTVSRVEFIVDGGLKWTESLAPYIYGGDGNTLDTRSLANGSHTLAVKTYAADGSTSSASASVLIANDVGLTLVSSVKDGSTITGQVSWTITPSGKSVSKMDFYIDSQLKWTERLSPWVYRGDNQKLDTSPLSKGQHTLTVKAYTTDGTMMVLMLKVTVG
jgi:hypothetical protein